MKLLPTEKTDLKVDYDYATNVMTTHGLQLIGMKTTALEKEKKNTYIDSVEYVPLINNVYSVRKCSAIFKGEEGYKVSLKLGPNVIFLL